MSQSLPTDGFRWLNNDEIQELFTKLKDVPEDGVKGYILEVDLEIPLDKHDYFNQYFPASEHLEVTEDMLSPLNKFYMEKLDLNHVKCTKLTPNLHDKHKYVIHYRTLELYQKLGVVVKRIHRVIEFNQRPWLKEYIDFNTQQRKMAKNTFEKNFFKLMTNSVFGKVNAYMYSFNHKIVIKSKDEHFITCMICF